MATVFLALGSNLGERHKNITAAICELEKIGVKVEKCSTIIETNPAGGPTQGKYLNAVLKSTTNIPPETLLTLLKSIEKNLGRIKILTNGPRTIDIDILLYDQLKINTAQLTIPHPRMLQRDFVIGPLKEIEPDLMQGLQNANN